MRDCLHNIYFEIVGRFPHTQVAHAAPIITPTNPSSQLPDDGFSSSVFSQERTMRITVNGVSVDVRFEQNIPLVAAAIERLTHQAKRAA